MDKKRVLAIDGGGMKGIVSAILLKDLEIELRKVSKKPNAKLADYFDLIAGTSTGSILTALYLYPNEKGESKYSADEVLQFYIEQGEYIFKRRFGYPFYGAKYTNRRFQLKLYEYFGNATIGDLRRPCLLTAYDATRRSAVFFNTVSGRNDQKRNYPLVDAVLASGAAPTYLPPSCLKVNKHCIDCLIDGGVVANNPSMCALIESLKLPGSGGIENTIFLSVGNVTNQKSYSYNEVKRWGLLQWPLPLLDIFMDGSEQTVDYQMKKLFKSLNKPHNYYRMQWITSDSVPKMDDASEKGINEFVSYGKKLAYRERYRLQEIAKKLVD